MRILILSIAILACAHKSQQSVADKDYLKHNSIWNSINKEDFDRLELGDDLLNDNFDQDKLHALLDEIERQMQEQYDDDDGNESNSDDDDDEEDRLMNEKLHGIEIPICAQYAEVTYPLHVSYLTDCGKFYKCANGRGFLFDCPANMHWSVKHDRCDYPEMAGCKLDGKYQFKLQNQVKAKPANDNDDENSDEYEDSSEQEKLNAPKQDADSVVQDKRCEVEEDGDILQPIQFAHPSDCQTFYKCFNGFAFKVNCPGGLHFNVKKHECDYPHVAGCTASE